MAEKLKNLIKDTEQYLEMCAQVDAEGGTIDPRKHQEKLAHLNRWLMYFQHERLIHLIVTVLFGLCAIMVFGIFVVTQYWYILPLLLLITVLLVPYIFHYFKLENGVQKLYTLVDEMEKRKEI
ncbi:MAG: hypothetical protein KBT07_07350 [Clostridiales bacterium]|nr:hypothetical protein [Candidatus Scatonaster coprocaballi]